MAYTRDPSLSLRDNICEFLKDAFEQELSLNGKPFFFESVLRAPLPKTDKLIGNVLSIMDVRERKTEEIGAMRCHLSVVMEFSIKTFMGDNIASELDKIITLVQQVARRDITAGGLSLNIVESGSELDLEGPDDRTAGGVVFWDVQYRHKVGDPTKHRGEP